VTRVDWYTNLVRPEFVCWAFAQRLADLQDVKSYTTVDHLSGGQIAATPIPVPPLAEQHRIVAKVDELMGHAKVLEERHLAASSARVRLRDAALHALAEAEDHAAAEIAWARIEEHFEDLFTEPEDVAPLRQAILKLAVRGRLVGQEASDGCAIRAPREEASTLLSTQSLRRSRPLPALCRNDKEGTLPHGWLWTRLGNVCRLSRGFDLPLSSRREGTVPVYGANGVVGTHSSAVVRGPCVITGRSGSIGGVHLVSEDCWPLNTALFVEQFFGNYPPFVAMLLEAIGLARFSSYSAVPTLNRNVAHLEPVALPPVPEQHRIVAKVDELMALCDTLEASLTRAKACREQFAGSISAALGVDPPETPDRNAA
jgi:type I restriction enzyme S subunit